MKKSYDLGKRPRKISERARQIQDFCRAACESSTVECILWPFAIDETGYGKVSIGGTRHRAHRYICRLVHGEPVNANLHAAHSCRNRHCVNPRHLRWATIAENNADMVKDGVTRRNEKHHFAKLTDAQVLSIRGEYAMGACRCIDLAAKYGVTEITINRIIRGQTRKHNLTPVPPIYLRGERSGRAKLTTEEVLYTRTRYKIGQFNQTELAALFNVSVSAVHLIVHSKNWAHLDGSV